MLYVLFMLEFNTIFSKCETAKLFKIPYVDLIFKELTNEIKKTTLKLCPSTICTKHKTKPKSKQEKRRQIGRKYIEIEYRTKQNRESE